MLTKRVNQREAADLETFAGDATAVAPNGTIFRPGRNAWRVARAERAAVLIDAANYYGTLRKALLEARRTVYIIGWDVDSRTPLVGPAGEPDDDLPRELGPFLSALVERRPELKISILLWDYSLFFTSEREAMPSLALRWKTPPQIDLCLDDAIPLGSSHHQKIVVIDEALVFSGGLDLTIRRWDTCAHDPSCKYRVDPAGKPYNGFHDVQMMVDGEAAKAMTELARAALGARRGGRTARSAEPSRAVAGLRRAAFPQCRSRDLAHRAALCRACRRAGGRDPVPRHDRERAPHDLCGKPVPDLLALCPRSRQGDAAQSRARGRDRQPVQISRQAGAHGDDRRPRAGRAHPAQGAAWRIAC